MISRLIAKSRDLFYRRHSAGATGDSKPLSEKIRAALEPFVDRRELAGAVTVIGEREKVLSFEAVGFADITVQKPMLKENLFWIASMSKAITAAAFSILVDAGELTVNDSVGRYLPEFKRGRVVARVGDGHEMRFSSYKPMTIRHLLTHTSGLPFSSPVEKPTLDLLPLHDRVKSYALQPSLFHPGSQYHYSNAGINTVGRIIEVVSQMPFEKFLARYLLQPLEMTDTTFRPNKNQLARLVKAYVVNPDTGELQETQSRELCYPLDDPKRHPVPAGGLFSTGEDLAHFCHMILNGGVYKGKRYLSRDAVRQMIRKQTGVRVQESMSLGWVTNGDSITHGGTFKSCMTIDFARELFAVFLVQHKNFAGNGAQSHREFLNAAGMGRENLPFLWRREFNRLLFRVAQGHDLLFSKIRINRR